MYEGGGGCLGENVENWCVMCGLVIRVVGGLLSYQVGHGYTVGSAIPSFRSYRAGARLYFVFVVVVVVAFVVVVVFVVVVPERSEG